MSPNNFKTRSAEIIEKLKNELSSIRASRPSPTLVENIEVEYYGQKMLVKQVGAISIKPPREIQIQAWDKEGAAAIIKSVEKSALGLTPNAEGNTVRIFLPELSGERREELSRHVKKITEGYRIHVRTARE